MASAAQKYPPAFSTYFLPTFPELSPVSLRNAVTVSWPSHLAWLVAPVPGSDTWQDTCQILLHTKENVLLKLAQNLQNSFVCLPFHAKVHLCFCSVGVRHHKFYLKGSLRRQLSLIYPNMFQSLSNIWITSLWLFVVLSYMCKNYLCDDR